MPNIKCNRWRELLGEELADRLVRQAHVELENAKVMPTITVTIYPQCEAIVKRRAPGMKHCRAHEEKCGVEGARYLIIGSIAES